MAADGAGRVDLLVIGAGAAGLTAAIWAKRSVPELAVTAVDGARTLGAKILVSGGGRCNVTNEVVRGDDFAGSSPRAVDKVLRQFDAVRTREWFASLGVVLKGEEDGKLFPVTDRAQTVLEALLGECHRAGVELRHPFRVDALGAGEDGFVAAGPQGTIGARRVVLATGGCSLPKTGSDGAGFGLARELGHLPTETAPALVPLVLTEGHPFRALSGVATFARLEVRAPNGRRLAVAEGSLLFTHVGLSGPAALDISRHWILAARHDPQVRLVAVLAPRVEPERLEVELRDLGGRTVRTVLGQRFVGAGTPSAPDRLPERLIEALAVLAGVEAATPGYRLPREARRRLVKGLTELELPVVGDRGYAHAEATAGGVPLAELELRSLESRRCPGLHLAGEVCDVDGRLGGFNFQWAWSSGQVAGVGAARALLASESS